MEQTVDKWSFENPSTAQIASAITELSGDIHEWAVAQGWWEDYDRSIPEQLALMHSELSEALEELRNDPDPSHAYYREDGKPEGFGVELADCIIRILDTAARYEIPIGEIILEKMEFNAKRPYRHGGKAF